MARTMDQVEIVAFTRPDTLWAFIDTELTLPYQRIVGFWHRDGSLGRHVGKKDALGRDEHVLNVPRLLGDRLLNGMRLLEAGKAMNCHYFGRLIAGMPESSEAPYLTSDGEVVKTPLALGELGIIGSNDAYPHHSLVGLGEEISESIQVMSGFGEFGIANNNASLLFYTRLFPESHQAIFRPKRSVEF